MEERRRLALKHTLRPIASAGCIVAAVLPFAGAAWRWGWSVSDAASAFVGSLWGALGVALAIVVAGVAAWMMARVRTAEGLLWLLIASFAAGVVGLGLGLI